MANEELFNERLKRVNDAVALKEPDRVPNVMMTSGLPFFLYGETTGASHKATYYEPEKTVEAIIRYHEEFPEDIANAGLFQSGKANEIAGTTMVDWPGRPGTSVPDFSTYQVIEHEYMAPEEYDDLIRDYSGFMINKYIPRAYTGLKGLEGFALNPSVILGMMSMNPLFAPPVQEALQKLQDMAAETAKTVAVTSEIDAKLTDMGFPPFMTGIAQVPFDIIGDYFRGTLGILTDQIERPEKIAAAAELFVDVQLGQLQYFNFVPMPVKRVFFPLHKGMDSYISPAQYETLYWKPFQKILKALVGMGVTPIIYTEGKYDTRVKFIREQLLELPPASCIIHFEEGDFAQLKKEFAGIAALKGGMSLYLLEFGTKQQVIDRVKYLVDNCAAGGGYLFDAGAGVENAKRENIEAVFDTLATYGKK